MRSTAARCVRLRGLSCSWLCGTATSGDTTIDLGGLGDGAHSMAAGVRVVLRGAGGAGAGPFPFTVDRTAPAQPQTHVAADPSATRRRLVGSRPDRALALDRDSGRRRQLKLLVYGPAGALVLDETSAGGLASAIVPAAALGAPGLLRRRSDQ